MIAKCVFMDGTQEYSYLCGNFMPNIGDYAIVDTRNVIGKMLDFGLVKVVSVAEHDPMATKYLLYVIKKNML